MNKQQQRDITINQSLRGELLSMMEIDRDLRRKAQRDPNQPHWDAVTQADKQNTTRMRQIIDDYGWPGKTLVGDDGAVAAWLLVQHADLDPDFQKRCLALMTATGPSEVAQTNLAYLEDRVRVRCNQPQLYGTQFHTDDAGQLAPPLVFQAKPPSATCALCRPAT